MLLNMNLCTLQIRLLDRIWSVHKFRGSMEHVALPADELKFIFIGDYSTIFLINCKISGVITDKIKL